MIQQQFEALKNLRKGYTYKDFEVINNSLVKKFYARKNNKYNPNGVVENYHEFYIDGEQIVEKIMTRECEIAIFSKKLFVLPEGYIFSQAISEEYKYYDNAVEIAFRFGVEFTKSQDTLHPVQWKSLSDIVKEIEYILLQGAGYKVFNRRADMAFFSFQDEHYLITKTGLGYVLHKRDSESHVGGTPICTYKTAMDLILNVGIHKLQFGIGDNGGD